MRRNLYCLACLLFVTSSIFTQDTVYIQTIEDLRNALDDYASGSITTDHIQLEAGVYNVNQAIRLDNTHNGINISGCQGVFLNGGLVLDADSFVDFNDIPTTGFTLNQSEASNDIKVLDLAAQGLIPEDLGSINWHALNSENFITPAVLWLDGEKMDLARWPNKDEQMDAEQMIIPTQWLSLRDHMVGQVSYYEVLETGTPDSYDDGMTFSVHPSLNDKITSWNFHNTSTTEGLWVDGVFHSSWEWEYNEVANITEEGIITLTHGSLSPFSIVPSDEDNPPARNVSSKSNKKPSHFHFENIPEELDSPGEYFIDRQRMLLYFHPPADWDNGQLAISTLSEDMISITNATNIRIENITLQAGHKNGIKVVNSDHLQIVNNTIRYFNQWGARITGTENIVDNCDIYSLGGGGVSLGNEENSYSLSPENNLISNSTIYAIAWDQKSQVAGVALSGVANQAIGNEIYDCSHFAIELRQAKKCLAENNRIHDLPNYHFFDGGAIYLGLGTRFNNRENHINNNYIYNIPTNGIYFDNYTNGSFASGNLLYNVGNSITEGVNYAAIYNHGGGQNTFSDNIAVDCSVIIKTGSYIVKQGRGYRYLNSWVDIVNGSLRPNTADYHAHVTDFSASDIASFIDMLDNLPSIVDNTIAQVTNNTWPNYRETWDEIGYDATVGNENPSIGNELQEWKNYFKLRYSESFIHNNLGLYTSSEIYDADNNAAAIRFRGDNKVFWEYSPYNNEFSHHVAINNEKYDVSTTADLFPNLVVDNVINENAYADINYFDGNLSSPLHHNLTERADNYLLTIPDCVDISVGTHDEEVNNTSILIYPNPTAHRLNVKLGALQGKVGTVRIHNAQLSSVYESRFNVSTNSNLQFSLEHLPSGIYYLSIVVDTQVITRQKLIVVKT